MFGPVHVRLGSHIDRAKWDRRVGNGAKTGSKWENPWIVSEENEAKVGDFHQNGLLSER